MTFPLAGVPAKPYPVQAPYVLHQTSAVPGIDMFAVSAPTIYTVPAGFTAVITGVILQCTAAVAVGTPATAGIGIAAGESDLFTPVSLTGFLAAGDVWSFFLTGKARTAPAGSLVKLGIDVAAIGTSQIVTARVLGFLF